MQRNDLAIEHRLLRGRVFAELGWLAEADAEAAHALECAPHDLDALSLCAKVKHMRGELSNTIACWAHIHVRGGRRGPAASGVLVHDAIGAPASVASHASAEIDQALALFQQGRVRDARAWCATIAARVRHVDATAYKIATLTEAWLADASEDLPAARALLEDLGRLPQFAHDDERLLGLVRIYDRIGTPETIESAVRICRHALTDAARAGRERMSLLGQLASLERRAGRIQEAEALDARFLELTRRRNHRASLHDLVRVAATDYLPLAVLRGVRVADDLLPETLERRERALVHAIAGESRRARELFASGRERIDRLYLAELDDDDAHLDGDDADNVHIVGWLLERHPRYFTDAPRRDRALRLLEAARDLAPQRASTWRHLAALHALAGRAELATRHYARANALEATSTSPIGRVLAAGVYHLGGTAKGLLHELWVHRTPTTPGGGGVLASDDIHGNLTAEMRASVRNTFIAVREYARAKLPDATADLDDFAYSYKLPKEDEPSGGLSAGLPTALAFLSVFLQCPVPTTIASTGTFISEAHDVIAIGRIGEAEHKVRGAFNANVPTLVLPAANRADIERSTRIPHAIAHDVVRYAADLDEAVKLVFGPDVFTRLRRA